MTFRFEAVQSVVVQVSATVRVAAPSPSPTSTVPDDLEVTPGLVGFLATFALAAACVLLFLSLTRHLRRANVNARERGLPVSEPKRRGQVEEPETQPSAADGPAETPRDTPPDSPGDWSEGGRGTSSS